MFDLRARQELNRGFSDALGRGVDLALTPVVFGLIGWLVDRALGTGPVLTVVVATIGVVGTAVKVKLGYDRDMSRHEGTAATAPRAVAPAPLAGGAPSGRAR